MTQITNAVSVQECANDAVASGVVQKKVSGETQGLFGILLQQMCSIVQTIPGKGSGRRK